MTLNPVRPQAAFTEERVGCWAVRAPRFTKSGLRSLVGMRSSRVGRPSHPDEAFEVLRERRHQRLFLHALEGAQPHAPQTHLILRLAEQLFDQLPQSLRHRIALAVGL